MLFEVALVKKPTKKEVEEGFLGELLVAPECYIAHDAHSAGAKSTMKNREKVEAIIDRVEVLVRPFVNFEFWAKH